MNRIYSTIISQSNKALSSQFSWTLQAKFDVERVCLHNTFYATARFDKVIIGYLTSQKGHNSRRDKRISTNTTSKALNYRHIIL